jgi:hypothetical protein
MRRRDLGQDLQQIRDLSLKQILVNIHIQKIAKTVALQRKMNLKKEKPGRFPCQAFGYGLSLSTDPYCSNGSHPGWQQSGMSLTG